VKKKFSEAMDAKMDKKRGVKENSKQDMAMDAAGYKMGGKVGCYAKGGEVKSMGFGNSSGGCKDYKK
jgi:hypothetical protein